jgi:hypothetical protein|tara:strand:+ start:492 stop:854 length:363 start_codon:yes stop_codon:yes gene_type:complete
MDAQLTDDTLFLYAAKHYYNPQFSDIEEFFEDLKRFKYIKRLVNRYLDTDEFPHRLLLNHIIVIFNVFGIEASLKILELRLDEKHWPVIKPILLYLSYIRNDQYTGIEMDQTVVEFLRTI